MVVTSAELDAGQCVLLANTTSVIYEFNYTFTHPPVVVVTAGPLGGVENPHVKDTTTTDFTLEFQNQPTVDTSFNYVAVGSPLGG